MLGRNNFYRKNNDDNNKDIMLTPQKIPRWVLPVKSPEEEDEISLRFGEIPWNALHACCKNALLNYGRGNQRTLGHKPPTNNRSNKYAISAEEMGKNLLRNGVY